MTKGDKTIWVICSSCGHNSRKHSVLFEKVIHHFEDPYGGPPTYDEFHRLVECMGCETVKYVTSNLDRQAYQYRASDNEEDLKVYPDSPGKTSKRRLTIISGEDVTDNDGNKLIPDAVWKMYRETIDAFNAGVRTLAGGGLRAVVEAICIDKLINAPNLMQRIEELANQGLLTKAQAELLHEERYIGNAALHEMATPSPQDIEDGLGIVEGLITTIYILPSKAKRIKDLREANKKAKPPGKK